MIPFIKNIKEFYDASPSPSTSIVDQPLYIPISISILFLINITLWVFTIVKLTNSTMRTSVRIACIFFIVLSVFTTFPFYLISLVLIYTYRNTGKRNVQKKKAGKRNVQKKKAVS